MADWLDKTSDFTASVGSWDGSKWVPAHPSYYSLQLVVSGSWAGFSPTAVRVTFTGAEAEGLSTYVKDGAGTTLNDTTQFWTGYDVDSDLTVGSDIALMTFAAWDAFTVTKIEFYGDEVEEEPEEVPVVSSTPGTALSWSNRLRPGSVRGRKHFPLRTKT